VAGILPIIAAMELRRLPHRFHPARRQAPAGLHVTNYGTWVYALLFLIIFVETGVVVMPFLPGDSLLFVVGAMCGVGLMRLHRCRSPCCGRPRCWATRATTPSAACWGPRCSSGNTRASSTKSAFDQAHAFYEKYGGVTIIAARFMPFLRTFAPFVAGVANMTRSKFTLFDVTGGGLWVGGIVTAGYFFGSMPWVQQHLDKIIWAMILIPGVLVLFGAWKARRKAGRAHPGRFRTLTRQPSVTGGCRKTRMRMAIDK
jgi:membrane-associated protein